ncbi:MAG: DUF1795 domain-containing protein [Gemmatimonadales bacterium]|nr:DUF1795 domain-containing protein [Gemmatimonadales bacterium]
MKINEGMLTIPPEWHDATVNVYTEKPPGERGLSITINRDGLPPGSTLGEYVEEQRQRLESQLKEFQLIAKERVGILKGEAHLLEFRWRSRDVGEVHQLLMTVSDGRRILNFAGTCPGRMDQPQSAQILAILRSFQPGFDSQEKP